MSFRVLFNDLSKYIVIVTCASTPYLSPLMLNIVILQNFANFGDFQYFLYLFLIDSWVKKTSINQDFFVAQG